MGKRRLAAGRRVGAAGRAAVLALAVSWAAGAAGEDQSDPGEAGEGTTRSKPTYEAVGPSERRGRTLDPRQMEADTGEPAFGNHTEDLKEFPGEARELGELSRPPGPTRKKAEWEVEGIPGPLKLRRLPGEGPAPDAPLLERICDADRARDFAERELRDAVRAYKRARRGEYPRGRDKWLVIERRDIAVHRVERADADWEALLEEASRHHIDVDAEPCVAP